MRFARSKITSLLLKYELNIWRVSTYFNWVRSCSIEKYSGLAILWRPWKGRWWCCPFSLSPPSWRSIEDCTWNYPALGGKCHVVFIQKMHKELIVMCSNGKKYVLCICYVCISLGTNAKIPNFEHYEHWMSEHWTFRTSHVGPKSNFKHVKHHKKLNSLRTSNCMFQD